MERDSERRPIFVGRLLNSCFWSANWICEKKKGRVSPREKAKGLRQEDEEHPEPRGGTFSATGGLQVRVFGGRGHVALVVFNLSDT